MTRPGRMKEQVAVQVNTVTPSDYGENADSWATTATLYADVEEVSAMERLSAGQALATRRYRIRVRRQPTTWSYVQGGIFTFVSGETARWVARRLTIRPKTRLLYRGRLLEVVSAVDVGERHAWTEAVAVEMLEGMEVPN